jgi:uridine phosphorylase
MTTEHLPITGLPIGGVSPSVLVCGDPARARLIAAALDNPQEMSHRREYLALRGSYHGLSLTVCSHGVGAPGAAAAFEELIVAGGRVLLRVGTCGGLQPDLAPGDLIIATAAVQNCGVVRELVPAGYPAAANGEVVAALRSAAARDRVVARHGLVLTRDAFYAGVLPPGRTADVPDYRVLSAAGVLAVEMECAALFVIGSLRGARTGAILTVDGNVLVEAEAIDTYRPDRSAVHDGIGRSIQLALLALEELS